MKIDLQKITVRELTEDYIDDGEDGVSGYGGRLDIRPRYQRNFVYADKERNAVIESINKNFPLNTMYWAVRDDDSYEIIDGQQRTISIAQYVTGVFSVNGLKMHNLTTDQQEKILKYKLTIYVCDGTDSERLDWFKVINIAGKPLSNQELRNAVYAGSFLSDAKRYFSRRNGPAYNIAKDYISGNVARQDYLEAALKWISSGRIEEYMSEHQHDPTAAELWTYFISVMNWVESIFIKKRNFMKGVDWGILYNENKGRRELDPKAIEIEIEKLAKDDDVTNNKGIYAYLLSRNEKHLSIRKFSQQMRETAYEKQKGVCPACCGKFAIEQMHADHIEPWSKGGKTIAENCKMLCEDCNRQKTNR